MQRFRTKVLLIVVVFAVFHSRATSQTIAPDTSSSPAFKSAVAFYSNSFARQLRLFNGKEYAEYLHPFTKGQPYYLISNWSTGTVQFQGTTYNDVPVLYNIVSDEVIILHNDSISKIQLRKNDVAAFSMLGHSFINLSDSVLSAGMRDGYYDVLVAGKTTLLAKRQKFIQSYARQTMEYEIYSNDHYYLRTNNNYAPVTTKKAFLAQFGDSRKVIQQFINKSKLNYRRDKENTIVKAVEYYNQITR